MTVLSTLFSSQPASNTVHVQVPDHGSPSAKLLGAGAGGGPGKPHWGVPPAALVPLTPPNSISPTLPPHRHGPGRGPPASPAPGSDGPSPLESDIDLLDEVEHAAAQDRPPYLPRDGAAAPAPNIDAALLATHYLPDMLVDKGATSIRDMMMMLVQRLPGFSDMEKPKARRLVTNALEGQHGGGRDSEVVFIKKGWGKWTAELQRQPWMDQPNAFRTTVPIAAGRSSRTALSPPPSLSDTYATSSASDARKKPKANAADWNDASGQTADVDPYATEDDAETMSVDESDSHALFPVDDESDYQMPFPADEEHRSRPTHSIYIPRALLEDMEATTDEEDWSNLSPLPKAASPQPGVPRVNYNELSRKATFRWGAYEISKDPNSGVRIITDPDPIPEADPDVLDAAEALLQMQCGERSFSFS